jgi:hypothetical protein
MGYVSDKFVGKIKRNILCSIKGKDKGHPRTDHESPELE